VFEWRCKDGQGPFVLVTRGRAPGVSVGLYYWTKMPTPGISEIPAELVGGVANLPDLLVTFARLKGIQRPDADRILSLVPAELKSAPCFLDRLTATWRYVYGHPFTGLPDGNIVLGTHMYHEVGRLLDIISCAERLLTSKSLSTYLTAMSDRAKHEDALVEFAPVLRLDPENHPIVEYEVPGAGNKTIDWLIQIPGLIGLLLEVKNRVGDLFKGLCRSQLSLQEGGDGSPEPVHDINLLFKSIEQKFPTRKASEAVQAAWIKTGLKQEESELNLAFEKLDPGRLHVAILGDWDDDVYMLANDDQAKQVVMRALRVTESRRFVFSRGASVP
jgi:hypothetical protein